MHGKKMQETRIKEKQINLRLMAQTHDRRHYNIWMQ
jgi:hypothetical protein